MTTVVLAYIRSTPTASNGGKANLEQMSSMHAHTLRFGDTEMLGRRETPIDSRDLID